MERATNVTLGIVEDKMAGGRNKNPAKSGVNPMKTAHNLGAASKVSIGEVVGREFKEGTSLAELTKLPSRKGKKR